VARKKPRTPPPPSRPVQAPQRRRPASRSGDDLGLRHRRLLYYAAGGGAVVLVAIVLFVVLGGGSNANAEAVASAMTKAGCTYKTVNAYVPKGQGTHVDSLTAKLPWNTDPPSNGQHYPEWAVWGFYTQPVNPRMVVHNQEHGGVILWWGSQVPSSTVSRLKAFYDEQPVASFGTPYPKLGSKIAITAWTGDPTEYQQNGYYGQGHIGVCSSYTAATKTAFETFRDAYRGKGPEGIPLCDDHPGDSPETSSC
jgi:Protein of unknown function (DUF3105)